MVLVSFQGQNSESARATLPIVRNKNYEVGVICTSELRTLINTLRISPLSFDDSSSFLAYNSPSSSRAASFVIQGVRKVIPPYFYLRAEEVLKGNKTQNNL